ncbi:hypothetical protein [Salinicola tamaricis]|uniref:hypothetical protein n=1 Tax=Salinicola tamaricis TaxID=1771309 RepID=UPI000D09E7C5|nr:hypothetical protein [Salinicola tamaricis]
MEKALFEPDSKTPNLDFEAYVIATQHKAAESGDDKLGERLQQRSTTTSKRSTRWTRTPTPSASRPSTRT